MICDSCGICADEACMKKANKRINCKPVAISSVSMKHHWVKGKECNIIKIMLIHTNGLLTCSSGNLPPESVCSVCEHECGTEKHLSDWQCSWCQKTVHEKCQPNLADLCNLGRYRSFIIPPNCITLKHSTRGRLHSQCLVSSIKEPQWGPQWKPLIVIGNS